MKKLFFSLLVIAFCSVIYGREIKVGTFVANPGSRVTVPVSIDSAAGLAYAGVRIAYDPQVLVPMKVAEGTLAETLDEDFVVVQDNAAGWIAISLFGSSAAKSGTSGTLANVTFAVRDGTAGSYSDLSISKVEVGDATAVRDVTADNPVTTVNGMVRVMGTSAAVSRLENAQTVVAETQLGSLALKSGDAIQASDAQTNAVCVAGNVTSESAIPVVAPANGWASGTYTLLVAKSSDLSFTLADVTNEVQYAKTTEGEWTAYYATVTIPGIIPIASNTDEGEALDAGTQNLIRDNLRAAYDALEGKDDETSVKQRTDYQAAKRITVTGPKDLVSTIADMGISPAFALVDDTGTLKLTYAMPELAVIAFDPETGYLRFKVTPGEGNAIVSELATGYVHVYGSDKLDGKQAELSQLKIDLTPYLESDTKGEGEMTVSLGTKSFLRIKIEK